MGCFKPFQVYPEQRLVSVIVPMPELYMLPLNRVKMTRLITFFIELTDRESFSLCVLVLVKDALFRTIVR